MTDRIARAERSIRERWPDVRLLTDEPMSRHTSFRIGGPAPLLIIPSGPETLEGICRLMDELELRPLLSGNGSDRLVEDSPLSFPVIQTHSGNETARLKGISREIVFETQSRQKAFHYPRFGKGS